MADWFWRLTTMVSTGFTSKVGGYGVGADGRRGRATDWVGYDIVPSSFTEVKETVGPFNSIYSFRDSLSSVADHVAATLNLPSPQPYTQRGTEFFENNKVLSKALNDYKHAFLHGKSISEVSLLVPEVVETIKNSIERLINEAGAKTLMVSGILPVGCFPGFRTLFPEGDSIGKNRCHKGLNMFSKHHNDHL
ncbi:GDSL esterase/lipase At1g28570-like [Nicotiana sylvestris]|uniref:GDSL esterase/lipase At1g28570-like n=1 Tax=Nicotiana sylvestris TaxID=4096 RepID=UPI00388C5935